MDQHDNNVALLALYLTPGFSWARTRAQIEEHGSPSAVLQARYSTHLLNDEHDAALAEAIAYVREMATRGVNVTTLWGDEYPRHLRTVHDAPPVLFWQGQMDPRDTESVAIVGTRVPDDAGREFAHDLATALSANGTSVVSGLARGIDGVALRSALAAHGRTIGVIGTGHDIAYPAEHRQLQEQVAQHLLISQFAPGTTIHKRNFPMRNAVMSGFASVSVIVQAGETSGTRIQARAAVKHGRPLIISTAVLNATDWARDLVASDYDITVVHDANEALQAIGALHERRLASMQAWDASAFAIG